MNSVIIPALLLSDIPLLINGVDIIYVTIMIIILTVIAKIMRDFDII